MEIKMNVKLMMKAINDLNGDLAGSYLPCKSDKYVFINNNYGNYICHDDPDEDGGNYTLICTCDQFNQLISELSNWQPTLQAAETVEVDVKLIDGEAYQFSVGSVKSAGIYLARMKTFTYYGGHVPLSMVKSGSITHLIPAK
jgi:hypothetical protein